MARRSFSDGFSEQMKDPKLKALFESELQQQLLVQRLLSEVDKARISCNITKAQLAANTSLDAVTVRRVLTSPNSNPRLSTLVELANALNLELKLVPKDA